MTFIVEKGSYADQYAQEHEIRCMAYFYDVAVNEDGVLTGFTEEPVGNIVIPGTVDGVQIKAIGEMAFFNCENLTGVRLPAGVTYIGEYAFMFCGNLTDVRLPAGVTFIGEGAFAYCGSLTNVDLPDSVEGTGYGAFFECAALTSFRVPAGMEYIGEEAFYGCGSLSSVIFPANSRLTRVGEMAFCNCGSLSEINLPDSVTELGEGAFYRCGSLTSFRIPKNLTVFDASVLDGSIARKAATRRATRNPPAFLMRLSTSRNELPNGARTRSGAGTRVSAMTAPRRTTWETTSRTARLARSAAARSRNRKPVKFRDA